MASYDDGQERTESPTDERREQFRKRGDIAYSRELVSVFSLAGLILFLSIFGISLFHSLKRMFIEHLSHLDRKIENIHALAGFSRLLWMDGMLLILPIFAVTALISIVLTFAQTRFNFSWDRISFDLNRLNPITGLLRLFTIQPLFEMGKGAAKTIIVAGIVYLILFSELAHITFLYNLPILSSFIYWGKITKQLLFSICGFLLFLALLDYAYNFFSFEQKIKMTKQELKEDYRQRELDPNVKARLRKMQRDFSTRKTIEATKKATVLITNPTHFSIAIRYELGMRAPIVVAKGMDHLALRMREIAKEIAIPIVENKPLAQTLYKTIKINQEIPETLYKALSEVISYVFKLKGVRLN